MKRSVCRRGSRSVAWQFQMVRKGEEMRYIVTQEIKSETQVLWFIYLQDLAFLTVWNDRGACSERKCTRIFAIYDIFSFVVGALKWFCV